MFAEDFEIGTKFTHKFCGTITVVGVNGIKFFENSDGDLFRYIDEDLIEE